ncbi:MAG: hypothetical protein R3D29_01845 [Nitratireductor sp.]
MEKISAVIFGAIIGGLAGAAGLIAFLDWGTQGIGQITHTDPTRADYVDLLLTLVTVLLSAVGLAVTVGALVVGLVAFKTLREIKDDAADAAATKIKETMASDLEPNVNAKVKEALPAALQTALLDNELGHRIMSEMAQKGELDEVLERVAMRMQGGGPVEDGDDGS